MRVFVFGAGASVHAGYPLNKDLGPRLVKWAADNPPPQAFPFWINADELAEYGSLDNIEEVVTKLEASKGSCYMLAGLREALCSYFDSIRTFRAELYRRFAGSVVSVADVIITFNYDLSLELEMKRAGKWEASDGYGFDLEIPSLPKSPIKLLKLHGSTNWVDLHFEGARGFFQGGGDSLGTRPVFPWGLDHLGYAGVCDPKYRQGGTSRTGSIVLPSRNKKYHVETSINLREREDFWNGLWTQAAEALRKANDIVIIGYSLPTADALARHLLLKNSNNEGLLTICCGSQSEALGHKFVSAGFKRERICTATTRFEDFLAQAARTDSLCKSMGGVA